MNEAKNNDVKITIGRNYLISIITLIFFAITGWGLLKLTEADRVYATKNDIAKIEKSIETNRCNLTQSIKDLHLEVDNRFGKLNDKIDDRFLVLKADMNKRIDRTEKNIVDKIDMLEEIHNDISSIK